MYSYINIIHSNTLHLFVNKFFGLLNFNGFFYRSLEAILVNYRFGDYTFRQRYPTADEKKLKHYTILVLLDTLSISLNFIAVY